MYSYLTRRRVFSAFTVSNSSFALQDPLQDADSQHDRVVESRGSSERLRYVPFLDHIWPSRHWSFFFSAVFERMMFVLLGVCVWEVFATCDFEWSILTRRRKFKWPLVSSHSSLSVRSFNPRTIEFSESSGRRPCIDPTYAAFFFLSRYCIVLAFIGL